MDKEKIVNKMNEYMVNISPKLKCDDDADLTLFYCDDEGLTAVAWFEDYDVKKFQFGATSNCNEAKEIVEKDIIKKFFQKGKELLQKQFRVRVIKNDQNGYLNLRTIGNEKAFIVNDKEEGSNYRIIFSESEIEKFKQDENLCFDWDRVELEEV